MLNGHIILPEHFAEIIWDGSDRIILKYNFMEKIVN
jgi:hypothetical protein